MSLKQFFTQKESTQSLKGKGWDLPGGPVVKNPPSNAGDVGSIPGRGTKIPHAVGQLSPCAATTEPAHSRASAPQLEKPACCKERSRVPQLRPDAAK